MSRKQYHLMLLGGVGALIAFFVVFQFINKSIENQISEHVKKIKEELIVEKVIDEKVLEKKDKKSKRILVASDLTPYKIVPQRKSRLFKNQQYWDIETRKALVQPDTIDGIQVGSIFDGINRSPDQIKKQIKRIDGRIKEYKKRIRNDPYDDYAEQKLQDLYMIKSTARLLSENVVDRNY